MRKRFRPSHATVVAYVALFIALGGTTYAATGGNFILGKSNSAGAPTQLSSSTTNSAGALKVTNTSATNPGRGITAAGGAGGYGLYASGGSHAKNTAAVHGQSGAGNAVEGYSTSDPASGVFGQDNNANSYGVAGHSDDGVAVVGDSSNGWAIQALGNTTQTRGGNGFVKAMAYVDPTATPQIMRCFNSQLPPSQATSGTCGITYSSTQGGIYDLDFGFQVNDRFASVTIGPALADRFAEIRGNPTSTQIKVATYSISGGSFVVDPFYILVY